MCGIAGIWNLNGEKIKREALEIFNDAQKHRGPDGSGYFASEDRTLGFGHRRLSILDLSERGKQPMSYKNGRFTITFNGEVYNFLELREELVKKGYKFESDTDTEVILAAYCEWGEKCLDRFNGMWAFAIWDEKEKKLFIARDRFGVKPFHYLHIPKKIFAFASETLPFKHIPEFSRKIDDNLLAAALKNPFVLEGLGYTIFENIRILLPGHFAVIKRDSAITQKRWWNTLEHLPRIPKSYDEQVAEFKRIFEDACRLRLRSDVPVGTALSGGLDSSSIYATLLRLRKTDSKMKRMPSDWQKAFVETFPGSPQDEKSFAEEVVAFSKGEAEYIVPKNGSLRAEIVDAAEALDAIYVTPLSVAEDVYEKMREKGIRVSMDGHGVDEMLFGYQNSVLSAARSAENEGDIPRQKELLAIYGEMFSEKSKEKMVRAAYSEMKERNSPLGKIKRLFPSALKKKLSRIAKPDIFLAVDPTLPKSLSDKPYDLKKVDATEGALFEAFHLTTLPTILRNFDRAAMKHGIEIRMPFLDWRLVSFVFALPQKSKLGEGFTKRILRDSMKGTLPENIRTRKLKIGLNAPLDSWFSNELSEFVLKEIRKPSFLNSRVWKGSNLRAFAEEKIANKSWTFGDAARFWPYLNATIIIDKNS